MASVESIVNAHTLKPCCNKVMSFIKATVIFGTMAVAFFHNGRIIFYYIFFIINEVKDEGRREYEN